MTHQYSLAEPDSDSTPESATDADWMKTYCFSTSVRRIDRVLTRLYDEALRPSGLVTTQYSLLSTLGRAPASLPLTQFAEAIDMDRSTLSRNLAPLEREGFVRIEAGADRRSRCVSITERGREKIEQTRPLWRSAQDRIAVLTDGDRIETILAQLADLVTPIRHSPESD